ncbi:MAG: serine/threonine-protein kinase, partial [Myxococcota bacterium]|nr:serine/threonine-protein kinase [Myxococcota bacterium]
MPRGHDGAPGQFVGDRYQLVRELGRGGMGVVWLGRDLRLDMDVAIKFRGVTHHDATRWLKREFRAVASLRHPNLVELYELVAHDRTCYFTMEYLPGLDPRRWVELGPAGGCATEPPSESFLALPLGDHETTRTAVPLQHAPTQSSYTSVEEVASPFGRTAPMVDFARIRSVLAQLAEGLAFLHAAGVIHRDVKPSNAIVVDGVVKLLDFGLALERARQAGDLAREKRVVGTAAYLAPEYLEALQVSPAVDIYSLGVLAFELITGAPPFGGTMYVLSRLQRQLGTPRLSSLNPGVPADLERLVERMLATEPAERPSALDVALELTGSLSQPRVTRRARRFVGREPELAMLAARIGDPAERARCVLVTGASGAGKSALIEEAISRAREPGTSIWRGRCHERERVPYRALDLIIEDLATELEAEPRLARELEHAAALARVFPALAPLIDPELADTPAADLRVERERALLAMTQLFGHLLHTPRGVIVIDDLQWADEDSLELLALLVERIDRPLTIVASWTTEGAARTGPLLQRLGERATALELPVLPHGDVVSLLADLAPLAPT